MTSDDDTRQTEATAHNAEAIFMREFARAALDEQRRTRRWGIFFKSLFFLYLVALLIASAPSDWLRISVGQKRTALIEITGLIADDAQASADNVVTGLRAAFEDDRTKGVIVRINSPGGSPVQAGYINDEIFRLREEHPDIPVYAVITDICASGGYYVAAAANEIYADKASIVGSIGVRMDGFGFVEAIDKLGIERRLLTAGEHKGFLDPFEPLKPDEVEHVRGVLEEIHRQFINTVLRGRRDRLLDDEKLFSGFVWTGEQGLRLGLVDALGSASFVAREIIGAEDIVDYTVREDYLARIGRSLGAALAQALSPRLELR
ncbi:MAG: S49 family peptidase [Gammaproteobacteria bacterium]|nr:S49 family peptidase [Gammaproteobacteria bacterium]